MFSFARFFKKVAVIMDHKSIPIYSAAAEVVGMTLKYMSEKETSQTDREWRAKYVENIVKMLAGRQVARPDAFITCLHKMALHYPQIIDK